MNLSNAAAEEIEKQFHAGGYDQDNKLWNAINRGIASAASGIADKYLPGISYLMAPSLKADLNSGMEYSSLRYYVE